MQRPDSRRRATNVVSLLIAGVVAGIVVAAAAFPLVGSLGMGAKAASDSFEDLPSDLKAGPPPLTSTLNAADGTQITTFYDENRSDIPIKQMAKTMQDAIVAAEDHKFFEHSGVDPQGVFRAAVSNLVSSSDGAQGGSTLTQQYVKQALFYSAKTKKERQAAIAPNAGRKMRELRYSIALEKKLSKTEILERYLNIANFGKNTYGVAAAAQAYFGKTADKLTVADAALLASIVKNPDKYEPISGDKARAKDRRDYVITEMLALKMIDQKTADEAKKAPIPTKRFTTPRKCENGKTAYGFYCGWFLDWWKQQPAFGSTPEEREANLYEGGYHITAALDPRMQRYAQESVDGTGLGNDHRLANGIVVVQPGTGQVKAMAINRNYGLKAPATTNPLLSGNSRTSGYQAGSTFKMFTMVAALEKGMPLNTSIYAPQRYQSKYYGGSKSCNLWCPKNASPAMTGNQTMWSGFGESANTYFVQLEEMVGVKAAIDAAEKLGLRIRSQKDIAQRNAAFHDDRAWGTFTLGVAQTTPLDMATAYATIAARGKYCAPTPLLKITDSTGKPLPFADPACKQVIRPEVADAAADAARCPVGDDAVGACTHPGGGDTAVRAGSSIDRPVAGKSGTTDNGDAPGEPTAWFVGFTPNLAAASFIANPAKAVDDVTDYARLPLTVFIGTMKRSLQLLPEKDFVRPPDSLAYGIRVTVPDVRGASLDDAKRQLEDAGFSWRLADNQEGSQYDQGLVARTDPWSGNSATKGGVVTIYVSSGNNGGNPGQGAGQSPGTGDGNQNQPGGGGNHGGGGRRPGGGGPPPFN